MFTHLQKEEQFIHYAGEIIIRREEQMNSVINRALIYLAVDKTARTL